MAINIYPRGGRRIRRYGPRTFSQAFPYVAGAVGSYIARNVRRRVARYVRNRAQDLENRTAQAISRIPGRIYKKARRMYRSKWSSLPNFSKGGGNLQGQIRRLRRQVYSRRPEVKTWHYANVSGQDITDSGFIEPISEPEQGDDVTERIGNRIRMLGMKIRMAIEPHVSTAAHILVRLVIFRTQDSSTPSVAGVLEAANPLSPLKIKPAIKIQVLRNWLYALDVSTRNFFSIDEYLKLKGIVEFSGTAGTNHAHGHLWMLAITNAGSNFPQLKWYLSLRFTDA
jgi:hypothetical protein